MITADSLIDVPHLVSEQKSARVRDERSRFSAIGGNYEAFKISTERRCLPARNQLQQQVRTVHASLCSRLGLQDGRRITVLHEPQNEAFILNNGDIFISNGLLAKIEKVEELEVCLLHLLRHGSRGKDKHLLFIDKETISSDFFNDVFSIMEADRANINPEAIASFLSRVESDSTLELMKSKSRAATLAVIDIARVVNLESLRNKLKALRDTEIDADTLRLYAGEKSLSELKVIANNTLFGNKTYPQPAEVLDAIRYFGTNDDSKYCGALIALVCRIGSESLSSTLSAEEFASFAEECKKVALEALGATSFPTQLSNLELGINTALIVPFINARIQSHPSEMIVEEVSAQSLRIGWSNEPGKFTVPTDCVTVVRAMEELNTDSPFEIKDRDGILLLIDRLGPFLTEEFISTLYKECFPDLYRRDSDPFSVLANDIYLMEPGLCERYQSFHALLEELLGPLFSQSEQEFDTHIDGERYANLCGERTIRSVLSMGIQTGSQSSDEVWKQVYSINGNGSLLQPVNPLIVESNSVVRHIKTALEKSVRLAFDGQWKEGAPAFVSFWPQQLAGEVVNFATSGTAEELRSDSFAFDVKKMLLMGVNFDTVKDTISSMPILGSPGVAIELLENLTAYADDLYQAGFIPNAVQKQDISSCPGFAERALGLAFKGLSNEQLVHFVKELHLLAPGQLRVHDKDDYKTFRQRLDQQLKNGFQSDNPHELEYLIAVLCVCPERGEATSLMPTLLKSLIDTDVTADDALNTLDEWKFLPEHCIIEAVNHLFVTKIKFEREYEQALAWYTSHLGSRRVDDAIASGSELLQRVDGGQTGVTWKKDLLKGFLTSHKDPIALQKLLFAQWSRSQFKEAHAAATSDSEGGKIIDTIQEDLTYVANEVRLWFSKVRSNKMSIATADQRIGSHHTRDLPSLSGPGRDAFPQYSEGVRTTSESVKFLLARGLTVVDNGVFDSSDAKRELLSETLRTFVPELSNSDLGQQLIDHLSNDVPTTVLYDTLNHVLSRLMLQGDPSTPWNYAPLTSEVSNETEINSIITRMLTPVAQELRITARDIMELSSLTGDAQKDKARQLIQSAKVTQKELKQWIDTANWAIQYEKRLRAHLVVRTGSIVQGVNPSNIRQIMDKWDTPPIWPSIATSVPGLIRLHVQDAKSVDVKNAKGEIFTPAGAARIAAESGGSLPLKIVQKAPLVLTNLKKEDEAELGKARNRVRGQTEMMAYIRILQEAEGHREVRQFFSGNWRIVGYIAGASIFTVFEIEKEGRSYAVAIPNPNALYRSHRLKDSITKIALAIAESGGSKEARTIAALCSGINNGIDKEIYDPRYEITHDIFWNRYDYRSPSRIEVGHLLPHLGNFQVQFPIFYPLGNSPLRLYEFAPSANLSEMAVSSGATDLAAGRLSLEDARKTSGAIIVLQLHQFANRLAHADLHSGNFGLNTNGRLVVYDDKNPIELTKNELVSTLKIAQAGYEKGELSDEEIRHICSVIAPGAEEVILKASESERRNRAFLFGTFLREAEAERASFDVKWLDTTQGFMRLKEWSHWAQCDGIYDLFSKGLGVSDMELLGMFGRLRPSDINPLEWLAMGESLLKGLKKNK